MGGFGTMWWRVDSKIESREGFNKTHILSTSKAGLDQP